MHYFVSELSFDELVTMLTFDYLDIVNIKGGRKPINYLMLYSGFDIETTNMSDTKHAYMYIWQIALNDMVLLGRSWDEFTLVIRILEEYNNLCSSKRIIIWIANLSFEFQFIRKRFNFTKIFAKEQRKPLYAIIDDCIELRDPLPISGGSLAQLAKDYTKTQKLVGDLDYSIIRNSTTCVKRMNCNIVLMTWLS